MLTKYFFWKYKIRNSQPECRFLKCTTAPEAKRLFCILPPKKNSARNHTQKKKKTKSEKKKTVMTDKTARTRLKGEKKRRYSWWFFLSFWTEHDVLIFPVFLVRFLLLTIRRVAFEYYGLAVLLGVILRNRQSSEMRL